MCVCIQNNFIDTSIKFDKIAKSKWENSNEKYFVYAKISIFTDIFMDQ